MLKNTGTFGLESDPMGLRTGRNSGYQALNLALHYGARRIILLGFDCGLGPAGETHWFGDHPHQLRNDGADRYAKWIVAMDMLARDLSADGVEVVNCSPSTALQCFKRSTIREELGCPERIF